MNLKQNNLRKTLKPQQIIFIGSKSIIKQGIKNCKRLGFKGRIHGIHRNEEEIEGVRCYTSVIELPEVPDVAFIAVRKDRILEIVKDLRKLGVSGCVCYTAGFSEVGNTLLEEELVDVIGDMVFVGPNCYGIINYLDHTALWPDHFGLRETKKGVAIISQSGNLSFNITMNDRSLPIAYILDVGNQATTDIADYVQVLCEDSRVTAIGLHIEGLSDIQKFLQAAKIALEKEIPIVAYKTGVSDLGSELTLSHTSSLAGSDDLYEALFKRLNIYRVESLSAFLETLKIFSVTGPLQGRKIGVLTVSGGESTIAADMAAKSGFILPKLNTTQSKEIYSLMTGFERVSNPLDYNTSLWGNEEKLTPAFKSFMRDEFDTTLLILDYLDKNEVEIESWETVIKVFINEGRLTNRKAVVVSVLSEGMPAYFREKLILNGITPLQGITDAFTALTAAVRYKERNDLKHLIPTTLLLSDVEQEEKKTVIWNEWESKQKLCSYGLKIPKGKVVSLNEQHVKCEDMQGPYVAKTLSMNLVHKTDVGGVSLNLQTEKEIKESLLKMHNTIPNKLEETQFLVEEMVSGAVAELNIGLKQDSQFGLVMVISMGGELINLLSDSVSILLPSNQKEILEALHSLKGIELLKGYRGRPKGDINAVIETALSVSRFAEAYKNQIFEVDINPLLVLPKGRGVIAVDAFIRTFTNNRHAKINDTEAILKNKKTS